MDGANLKHNNMIHSCTSIFDTIVYIEFGFPGNLVITRRLVFPNFIKGMILQT